MHVCVGVACNAFYQLLRLNLARTYTVDFQKVSQTTHICIYIILYKEKNRDGITQKKHQNEKIEVANTFYVPFHSRAKKLYNVLQKKFGITTVFKKTMTLGNLIK